jgi:hypothetical protein
MPAPDGGDDFVGVSDPLEAFGLGIVVDEEAVDRFLKVGDGAEDAAFEAALGQDGEEALDGVEPGSGRRRRLARSQPVGNLEASVRSAARE